MSADSHATFGVMADRNSSECGLSDGDPRNHDRPKADSRDRDKSEGNTTDRDQAASHSTDGDQARRNISQGDDSVSMPASFIA